MNIMIKSILLISIICSVRSERTFDSSIKMDGLEMTERSQISRFRNWHEFVVFDDNLSAIAQMEAKRLSDLGRLSEPDLYGKMGKNYV